MANQATLVYEADSSQVLKAIGDLGKLNRASEQVAAGADKLSRAQEKQAESSKLLLNARRGVDALHRQEADTLRALTNEFNPLLAAQNRYTEAKARLADAVQRNIVTEQQAQDQLQRLTAEFARAQVGIQGYVDGMQRVNNVQGSVANQFAQLNDVVVTAWGGMNPALIGMQQGMQVVQGFAGQSLPQALGTLRGAFAQLLNPVTLVTVGVIAGGAALIQWGASALGAGGDTDTLTGSVDRLQASVNSVNEISKLYSSTGLQSMVDKYGEVNAEILAMIENQKQFAINSAVEDARAAIAGLKGEFSGLDASMALLSRPGGGLSGILDQLGLSKAQFIELRAAMEDASNATTFDDQAAAMRRVNAILAQSSVATTEVAEAALEAEDAMRQLAAAAPSSNWMNAAISGVEALGASIRKRIGEAVSLRSISTAVDNGVYGEVGARSDPRQFVAGNSNTFDKEFFTAPSVGSGGGGGGGGGGSGVNEAQAAWDALNQVQYQGVLKNLETLKWGLDQKLISEEEYNKRRAEMLTLEFGLESQKNLVKYSQELSALNTQFEQKLIAEEVYLQRRAQLQYDYYSNAVGVEQNATSQTLSNLSSAFAQMNSLAGGGYDELLRAQKTFAAGSALINAYLAATQALADPSVPFLGKLMAYGNVLAAGMGAVNAIKGSGGGGRGAGASATTARQEPTRNVLVRLDGPSYLTEMAETIMTQIYEQSRDGRVIIQRDR